MTAPSLVARYGRAVLTALRAGKEPLGYGALGRATGLDHTTLRVVLTELAIDGKARRVPNRARAVQAKTPRFLWEAA